MRSFPTAAPCCLLLATLSIIASAHAAVPIVAGQVTAASSDTEFDVNGKHVLCDNHTEFGYSDPRDAKTFTWAGKPYLGEPLEVYGRDDRKAHAIHANRVVFAPSEKAVHGFAVITRMLDTPNTGDLLLRADGYIILLTPSTDIGFAEPLKSAADVHTNLWVAYQGRQRADGVLAAEKAVFYPNTVSAHEERLDAKYNAAPSTGPATQDLTTTAQHLFAGKDPRLNPVSHDVVTQDRVNAIGSRLIPLYQRELPDGDPTKIHFHFTLIDAKSGTSRIDLPNGDILVPAEAIARLKNDDQVAAYLADGIAGILEKQQVRDAVHKRLLAAAAVGSLVEFPIPLFAVPASSRDQIIQTENEQRIRVSLELMHDAGYDLREAPKAWWWLASKKQDRLTDVAIPDDAVYAYAILGSIWRHTIEHESQAAQ